MRRVVMASAAPQSLRVDALLSEEFARLHQSCSDLTPAVKAAVRAVVESLLTEDGLDSSLAAQASSLLDAVVDRPVPPHAPRRSGLQGMWLRAA
jgi:hypothetical protein